MSAGAGAATPGTLHVVSTPIGNMGDFSFRAVEVLRGVDVILAEDTRHTRHLLEHYQIATPLASHHEHNEAKTTPAIIARIRAGESVALVSDAGTPLLSDPGSRLVRAALDAGIHVAPVPGPSALLAALVAAGVDLARFTFFGFLPRSGSERRKALEAIVATPHTVVLYESPNRLGDTLAELEGLEQGHRAAAVAREMTKQFEEVRRGTLSELCAYYQDKPPRGEIVLVIGPTPPRLGHAVSDDLVRDRVRALRASGASARDAAALVAGELGVSKRLAYRLAQGPRGDEKEKDE
jgi:16S rRNA (cytidine1402-2'-O)-methyltransferase